MYSELVNLKKKVVVIVSIKVQNFLMKIFKHLFDYGFVFTLLSLL